MKAVVAAFNQEKALVGAFSVITNLQMELFEALAPRDKWGREELEPRENLLILHHITKYITVMKLRMKLLRWN